MKDLKKCDENFQPQADQVKTVKDAKEIFKKNCIYIDEKIKVLPFPCFEICSVMQSSFRQLQFIAGKSFLLTNFENKFKF